ncbi:MAG: DUF3344 domain-containing protein [Methanosarcinales archaeon]|nr:DUF3344 domain-containing protein [Methanosarcinales archaeon]
MKDRTTSRSWLFGILVLFVMLAVPPVSAYDHDQTYNANATYFVLEDVSASGYCEYQNVEVWINTSAGVGVTSGMIEFDYTYCCANVTSATIDPIWGGTTAVNLLTPGRVTLTIGTSTAQQYGLSGKTKVADMTVHCCNTSCNDSICCGTGLVWDTTTSSLSWVNSAGYSQGALPNVNWADGTYLCGDAIRITKTVWDGSGWVDALPARDSSYNGTDVRFNITVTANSLDLSNVVINDTMGSNLQYNNSATLLVDSSTAHTVNWTIGALAAGTSQSIEFDATIVGYGTVPNTAVATATVTDLGIEVQADDTATVNTLPPADVEVTKTVWDGSAWVNQITGAIGDTHRFRCEVENIGSPGMDVCDITVIDVLPAGLSYADNAKLQNHHGIWQDLTSLDIDDPANNTYGWIIDNWVSGECLQVGQKIVVEYDVTVENYGLSCNDMTAEAYCLSATSWVDDNDSACIDVPKPDLTVSDITVNYDASKMVNLAIGPEYPGTRTQCNNISVNITELNGIDVALGFNVTLEINGMVQACSPMQVPAVMAGGSTVTVYCDCAFRPIAGVQYNISATADSGGAIPESDEDNNVGWRNLTAIVNGYKGNGWQDGRNISALQCHAQGPINLIYSPGDSYSQSGWSTWNPHPYTVNWVPGDLNIPEEDTSIKKARLYVYYHGDMYFEEKTSTGITPDEAIANLSLKFNTYDMPVVANYSDGKGFGSWDFSSNWGVLVYNVTHKLKVGENNTALLYNDNPDHKGVSIEGMVLVVVYENPNEPDRIIWINEGCDVLKASSSYGVSPEEATTYAAFEGCEPIPLDHVRKATLVSIVQCGNKGDDLNRLYFNGGEWHGLFPFGYYPGTNIGIHEANVKPYLTATDNVATYQDNGDMFAAANSFLIVEKGKGAMSVEPDSDECYDVGEQFDVMIKIDPMGVPIRGAQFDLHYNKDVISVLTLALGDFLDPPVSITHTSIDNGVGVASFAASMTSGTNGMTEPGTFAIVHCIAVGQGATSDLNLTDVLAYDNSIPVMLEVTLDTDNSSVEVCDNAPPVPVAMSNYTYNNMADKILSKAHFNSIGSEDPDGIITMYEWSFGDGRTGVGPAPEHDFKVRQYWDGAGYIPANVTLVVTDDGMPLMDTMVHIDVNVWIGGDANGDGRVNIGDAVMVGYYWGAQCNDDPVTELRWYDNLPADMADLNNDGRVNIGDTIPVGFCWGHTAW